MSKVGGKSIKTLDDTEATQFIQDDGALEAVGRIMVADAFLGNTDRLLWSINLGNFFYAAAGAMATDVVRTIDNESNFVALQYNQRGDLDLNSAMRLSFIDNLLDRPSVRVTSRRSSPSSGRSTKRSNTSPLSTRSTQSLPGVRGGLAGGRTCP